ncbi:MAG TPA: glycosyltransferase family 4 protein [Polyangia bacterium]|nr:glycosyltransferase family 4 protein [Polyangia bacterium]
MRVTVIADPLIPVPPLRYGGSERIVGALCKGLVARGHQVRLLAGPGSRNYGELIVHRPSGASLPSRAYRKALFQLFSLWSARDADVVHSYGRLDYLQSLVALDVPLVASFMNPVTPIDLSFFERRARRLYLVSASDNHRRGAGRQEVWRTVYPAIEIERIPFFAKPRGDYLAFLGRLTANKGAKEAIAVARRTGLPLKIAGNISKEPGGAEYFEKEVRPHLYGNIEWVGEITDAQKPALLGGARALLFPIQWEEPFGISLAEAFAAGTPVIATRRGATSEQITHGRTGFICDTVDDMVEATRHIDELDRAACRLVCQQRFSAQAMTEHYLQLYQELIDAR